MSNRISESMHKSVAAGFALYFGREFFVPIALAILLNALLRPILTVAIAVEVPHVVAHPLALILAHPLRLAAALGFAALRKSGPGSHHEC